MIVNFTLLQATVFFPSFFLNASFSFPKAIHNSLLFQIKWVSSLRWERGFFYHKPIIANSINCQVYQPDFTLSLESISKIEGLAAMISIPHLETPPFFGFPHPWSYSNFLKRVWCQIAGFSSIQNGATTIPDD